MRNGPQSEVYLIEDGEQKYVTKRSKGHGFFFSLRLKLLTSLANSNQIITDKTTRTSYELGRLRKFRERNFPVPEVFDHTEDMITMEYLEGTRINDINPRDSEARGIFGQLVHLAYRMHQEGLSHGELSVSNAISNGSIVVYDFNLSFPDEDTKTAFVRDLGSLYYSALSWINDPNSIAEELVKNYGNRDILEELASELRNMNVAAKLIAYPWTKDLHRFDTMAESLESKIR